MLSATFIHLALGTSHATKLQCECEPIFIHKQRSRSPGAISRGNFPAASIPPVPPSIQRKIIRRKNFYSPALSSDSSTSFESKHPAERTPIDSFRRVFSLQIIRVDSPTRRLMDRIRTDYISPPLTKSSLTDSPRPLFLLAVPVNKHFARGIGAINFACSCMQSENISVIKSEKRRVASDGCRRCVACLRR